MIVKNNKDAVRNPREYDFFALRDRPEFADRAAAWFHEMKAEVFPQPALKTMK